jgi:uncharacterized protein YecE (DUF72 family)
VVFKVARVSIHIGTSGWDYNHWEQVLYPAGMPPRERLQRYTEAFDTVELNASFYHWPRDTTFAGWRRRLPPGFQMSVKAPRGLTHGRRLYAPERWLERIASSWHELADRRGVLLLQLPPDFERDDARLGYLLDLLPDWLTTAVELRHPSWQAEPVYALLERRSVAYCVMSGAQLPCVLRATAPHVYVRLHGPDDQHLYAGSYSQDALRWWADRLHEWQENGHEVYAYFNNDGGGNAVRNAWTLREYLAR